VNFYISYNVEYARVLSGVILENRQGIAQTKDKTGFQVKSFIDDQIALVDDSVIPYIMETAQGNLVAFFSLKMTGEAVSLLQLFIRANFIDFQAQITAKIDTFILSNEWHTDNL